MSDRYRRDNGQFGNKREQDAYDKGLIKGVIKGMAIMREKVGKATAEGYKLGFAAAVYIYNMANSQKKFGD